MIHIIYSYRNRDIVRVKNSLNSLQEQTCKDFRVFLIDFGSTNNYSEKIKILCEDYSFVNYQYCFSQFQPWNKSKALNSIIKTLNDGFCFVADVDMIFHPDFVKTALKLQQPETTVYFQVGFLSPDEGVEGKKYNEFTNYRNSTPEATGLSMFPVKVLQELRGFDEFYHFWGAEDTDMHIRLKNAGYPVEYYDKEILMLHQWHPSYRSRESEELTRDLQLSGIVQLNHYYLKTAIGQKRTGTNINSWGTLLTKEDFKVLEKQPVNFEIANIRDEFDAFLFGQLPGLKDTVLKLRIMESFFQTSTEYRLKKMLRKKVPHYLSLKEINDKLLLHIISFYRDNPYTYKVGKDLKSIEFAIKL